MGQGAATGWVTRLRARAGRDATATDAGAPVSGSAGTAGGAAATGPAATGPAATGPAVRSIGQRLDATLRREPEALSPRALRQLLAQLQSVVDPTVSEVEGARRAADVARWYAGATPSQRHDCWLLMSEQFGPDAREVLAAREAFGAVQGTQDEADAEIRLRRALASPRTRMLQRFSAWPQGMRFLVDLRHELLPALGTDRRLAALDAELESLLSTWFDVGFLELRRISWDSPASLIEKLIRYEAVHDVRNWDDIKNRLDSDRRCYGFFHPRLPDEPLIFVEVALAGEISDSITPLLDVGAQASDPGRATTAIFYSISNTQAGLKGVSFGDSLIKRVVETLCAEFPRLRTFATLSPIPGLRGWIEREAAGLCARLPASLRAALERELGQTPLTTARLIAAFDSAADAARVPDRSPAREVLLAMAAHYLGRELVRGKPADPVARFHLGNGARVERLNWAADPSAKGRRQSFGLMVNYLYDLRRLDRHRGMLAQGKVPISGAVEALYR